MEILTWHPSKSLRNFHVIVFTENDENPPQLMMSLQEMPAVAGEDPSLQIRIPASPRLLDLFPQGDLLIPDLDPFVSSSCGDSARSSRSCP